MAYQVDLYTLPSTVAAALEARGGIDNLKARCADQGEHLGTVDFPGEPSEFLTALEELLRVDVSNLVARRVGGIDGTRTDPTVGRLTEDELADVIDALDRLSVALEVDDEDDDEDEMYGANDSTVLRDEAADMADSLGISLEEDVVSVTDGMLEALRSAGIAGTDVIGIVSVATAEEDD